MYATPSFLSFLEFERDRSGELMRVAIPPLADDGNYLYDRENDSLTPIDPADHYAFVQDVLGHGHTLRDLRSALTPEFRVAQP